MGKIVYGRAITDHNLTTYTVRTEVQQFPSPVQTLIAAGAASTVLFGAAGCKSDGSPAQTKQSPVVTQALDLHGPRIPLLPYKDLRTLRGETVKGFGDQDLGVQVWIGEEASDNNRTPEPGTHVPPFDSVRVEAFGPKNTLQWVRLTDGPALELTDKASSTRLDPNGEQGAFLSATAGGEMGLPDGPSTFQVDVQTSQGYGRCFGKVTATPPLPNERNARGRVSITDVSCIGL